MLKFGYQHLRSIIILANHSSRIIVHESDRFSFSFRIIVHESDRLVTESDGDPLPHHTRQSDP